jgi:nitrate reductase (cytochrome), electron transfer subunit
MSEIGPARIPGHERSLFSIWPMNAPQYRPHKRAAWIAGVILLTAAISGFFMGLQQTVSYIGRTQPVSLVVLDPERVAVLETRDVPVAVEYQRQNWLQAGVNAGWRNHLTNLVVPEPVPVDDLVWTETDRLRAIAIRADHRAYEGAPPTVPHPITQSSAASCIACHGPGLAVKDRIASRMSHAHLLDCTQCHVPAQSPLTPFAQTMLLEPLAENTFVGLAEYGRGVRAWPQAPPTIPHPTFMRSDCMSCHGPLGSQALRTPHPERQSCTQCHVPDAGLDQYHFLPAWVQAEGVLPLRTDTPMSVSILDSAELMP